MNKQRKTNLEKRKKIFTTLLSYRSILESVPAHIFKRNKILSVHFPELLLPIKEPPTDVNSRVSGIIDRHVVHPNVYLASSLGFTKSNWSKTIERILIEVGLPNKMKCVSGVNMLKFEKLKFLIFKYVDKKIKKIGNF